MTNTSLAKLPGQGIDAAEIPHGVARRRCLRGINTRLE